MRIRSDWLIKFHDSIYNIACWMKTCYLQQNNQNNNIRNPLACAINESKCHHRRVSLYRKFIKQLLTKSNHFSTKKSNGPGTVMLWLWKCEKQQRKHIQPATATSASHHSVKSDTNFSTGCKNPSTTARIWKL